jgi:hypothetical protein
MVAAAARLDAPPINPANAAAASKPVDEPKIIVLRFMISFLSMGNGGVRARLSALGRDSDFVTKNVTIQKLPGSLFVEVESPPFHNYGMRCAFQRAVRFRAIIGRQIFQKTSYVFPHNRLARRAFD